MRDRNKANQFTLPIADVHILNGPITIGAGAEEQTLTPSDDKVLFSFTLLHSFPIINSNGVTFAYPLLNKSISSAVNSPIDYEHLIEGSPKYDGENVIIGAIISAELPKLDDSSEIFPTEGQPVTCVGILWRRISEANQIVADLEEGKEWRVSMEVTRNVERDVFLVGSEVIAQDNTEWDAAFGAWIQRKQYKGKDVGLALGGTGLENDDSANFFGAGIVWNPADEDADIHDFSIVPLANKSNNQQFMAIATHKTGKEINMAKETKIVIKTGGVVGDTSLTINGTKVEDFDDIDFFSSKFWEDWGLYWSTYVEGEPEGVKETRSFRFDPVTASIVANEKGGNPMMNPKEVIEQIAALLEGAKDKYANWTSPEDLESTVAAKLKEKEQSIRDEYANHISPDDLAVKIEEAVKAQNKNEEAYVSRETQVTEASLELTQERKDEIRKFEISEDGDKKFKDWLTLEQSSQTDMIANLEKRGIEVTEDVKKSIAAMSNTKDPRFESAVAMLTSVGIASSTTVPGNGELHVDPELGSKHLH